MAALACIFVAGCRGPAAAPPQNSPVTVRLDALLPLHPAWADVHELDILIAHTAGLVSPAQNAAASPVPLPEAPMPPPLNAGTNPLTSRPPSVDSVTRAAASRLNRLRDSLKTRVDRVVERERKQRMEKVDADVAAKKADLQAAAVSAPIESVLSEADRRELRRLQFREIAFESQVAALLPPARGEAETNLKEVRRQIAAIEAKAPKPGEELQAKVQQQVDEYRKTRVAAMEQELAARRAALTAETTQRLDPYRRRLASQIELPPAPSLAGKRAGPVTAGPMVSPAQVASAAKAANPAAPLPTGVALASLRDQRERLVRTISDEVRTRVLAVAAARRWTVSFAPRAGYIDVTDRVASALRSELEGVAAGAGNSK